MVVKLRNEEIESEAVPTGWRLDYVRNLCATSSGTTPSRSAAERYYRNGTIYWVKTTDLTNMDISATEELVTKTALDETSLRVYPVATVLVAMYGGFNQIGRTGLLKVPAAVNQAITAIQTDPKSLVPEYLINVLNYRVSYWKTVASSSRRDPNITSHDIKKFPIIFPGIREQRAIATALSDVDALITSLDRLIAKKRDIKQAVMQQLLTGKTRLPGFSGELKVGYKQTEVGKIPEDWNVKKLRDLCASIVDGTHYTPRYVNNGIPFYSVENITANNFTNTKFISLEEHNKLIRRCKPDKGDILLTRIGSLGYTKFVDWDVNASIYVSLALLRTDTQQILADYLYGYSKSAQFVKDVERRSLMNATPIKINMGQIGNIPICCPPLPEQQAIADILTDMDTEITVLEQKRDKTCALKQSMMQELLTGKTRLL